MSLLSIVDLVDSLPYGDNSEYYTFVAHDGNTSLGQITQTIAEYFDLEIFLVNHQTKTVTIRPEYDTFEKRNQLFAEVALLWKQIPALEEPLVKGWRNELYTIYNPTAVPYMLIERAFSVLVGVVTYGVHINGYVPPEKSSNGKLKFWIAKRSPTKPTFPGMLDNTVAGGLGYPHGIWETAVKECFEEAGLPEDFVESKAKRVGLVQYIYVAEQKRVQPEVQFIYDLEFDDETTIVPHPEDGEAEGFKLMDVDEVLQRIRTAEFKPNCALVVVDFLMRIGYITPENEPNYDEIAARMRRPIPFPLLNA